MLPSSPKRNNGRWFAPVIIGLALIGFADATFLTVEHYRQAIIPCTIVHGCQVVTTSRYATIGPIPIALLGALYYLAVIVTVALTFEGQRPIWRRLLPWLTMSGFVFSLYLVALQAFVIHAFCLYCLLSAGTSTLIFLASLIRHRVFKRREV